MRNLDATIADLTIEEAEDLQEQITIDPHAPLYWLNSGRFINLHNDLDCE